jgi:hypothetical protein
MSPQQLDGERGNHLDDVYSLGASVYELLTSKPPFYSGNVDRQIREKVPPSLTNRRKELEIEGEPVDQTWEDVVLRCLAKDPVKRPQSVSEVAKMLSVPSPKTRRAKQVAAKGDSKKWTGIFATAAALLILGVGGWFLFQNMQKSSSARSTSMPAQPAPAASVSEATIAPPAFGMAIVKTSPSGATVMLDGKQLLSPATFNQLKPGRYPMRVELSGYETVEQQIDVKENQSTDLGTITLKQNKPVETTNVAARPKVVPNAVYTGEIRVKGASTGKSTPLTIRMNSELTSGTMSQTARRGDVVVKFNGVWDGSTFRGVTDEIESKPPETNWDPESFSLHFADDAKSATYECVADGKAYTAELTPLVLGSTTAANLRPVYKGTITGGTPLTIAFAPDRKSGTMTQTAKSGDVVVKFAGIWDGSVLRAVTNEVVSKPAKVKWDPESFTLRFSEGARSGSYECTADGKYFTAQLSPP